jgi:hypothetical protein
MLSRLNNLASIGAIEMECFLIIITKVTHCYLKMLTFVDGNLI